MRYLLDYALVPFNRSVRHFHSSTRHVMRGAAFAMLLQNALRNERVDFA